jgi:hypothetical protein
MRLYGSKHNWLLIYQMPMPIVVVETTLEPEKSAGCKRRRQKRAHDMHKPKFHFIILCCFLLLLQQTTSYHRAPCKKVAVRRQFQFTDCYVPNLNPELYLTEVCPRQILITFIWICSQLDLTNTSNFL